MTRSNETHNERKDDLNSSDYSAPVPDIGDIRDMLDENSVDVGALCSPLQAVVTHEMSGWRLDKALAQLFSQFSRARLQTWIQENRVQIQGKLANNHRQPVIAGLAITLWPDLLPEELAFTAQPIPLTFIDQDPSLLIINKPAGLVVHPAAGHWQDTLLNGLLYFDPTLKHLPRAGIVHRLDKETSGIMVVARTLAAQTDLVRQLQARTVKREYLALVWGEIAQHGSVDLPIGRDPRARTKMKTGPAPHAKSARTHFQKIAQVVWQNEVISLIACQLETGRTHQIRVHLASLGHALLGDPVYCRRQDVQKNAQLPHHFARQALHAKRLTLMHPDKQVLCQWHCLLAEDMAQLARTLGFAQARLDEA